MSHQAQAVSNETAAVKLKEMSFGDWMITAYFYAGLHYINEKIPACQAFDKHYKREEYLNKNHQAVFKLYKVLSQKSRLARYVPLAAQTFRRGTGNEATAIEKVLADLKTELGI